MRALGPLPMVEGGPERPPDVDGLVGEQTQVAKQEVVKISNDIDVDQGGELKIWCAQQSNDYRSGDVALIGAASGRSSLPEQEIGESNALQERGWLH